MDKIYQDLPRSTNCWISIGLQAGIPCRVAALATHDAAGHDIALLALIQGPVEVWNEGSSFAWRRCW